MSPAKMAGVGGLGVGVWVGGGGWGAEWSVKCLLDTWLGIGANWHHKSVWCTLMSDTHMILRDYLVGVLFSCILHHVPGPCVILHYLSVPHYH